MRSSFDDGAWNGAVVLTPGGVGGILSRNGVGWAAGLAVPAAGASARRRHPREPLIQRSRGPAVKGAGAVKVSAPGVAFASKALSFSVQAL